MNKAECFEELRIWKEARLLVKQIYTDFFGNRDYGFKDQIQRAGVSIMNNIAEGFERNSDADFARFLNIAKGSAGEVRSMYYAVEDLGYVAESSARERRYSVKSISQGLGAFESYFKEIIMTSDLGSSDS